MKNILLYMVDFYDYKNSIVSELQMQGWNVKWYSDEIKLTSFERIWAKIFKKYKFKKFDKYFKKTIVQEKGKIYDLILVIFAATYMTDKHINLLKQNNPKTKIVYYAWDSVSNFPNIKHLLLSADVSFSFDENDCEKYNARFLPLFFRNVSQSLPNIDYDVSTVMSFYKEKAFSLSLIINCLPKGIKKYIYLKLRDRLYYYQLKITSWRRVKSLSRYFKFNSLKSDEIAKIFLKSRAIIDCPLPNQNGLTMRTFECLALKKKLITTNVNIRKYDFYNENNIFVADGQRKVPLHFFETPFDEKGGLSNEYHISTFIKKLTLVWE